MPLLHRARCLALAGVTSLAVALPAAPLASPAVAAPAPVQSAEAASLTGALPAASSRKKKKASRSARSFAARSSRVLRKGRSLQGVPYRHGGSTPRGFDCSGFTSYVYRSVGVRLPRRASQQAHRAHRVSAGNARAGDLVFFRNNGRVYHVGIYAGKNRVLHSPRPGKRVQTVRIWTRNVSFGRVL